MSEWPLLCGMEQYRLAFVQETEARTIYAIRGSTKDGIVSNPSMIPSRLVGENAEVQQFHSEAEAKEWIRQAPAQTYFAIRGGMHDGVTTDSNEVPRRMSGEWAEFEKFDSRQEAEAWVQASQFFTVKNAKGELGVMQLQEFLAKAKGQKGWTIEGPNAKAIAVKIMYTWQASQVHESRKP